MSVDFDLAGKPILVTGATSGLGRAFAKALTAQGAHVIGTGRRQARLEALQSDLSDTPGRFSGLSFDVTDLDAMRKAVADAWEMTDGALWGLVNNSGVSTTSQIHETSESDYDFVMDTNVKAAFFLTSEVGKRMISRGGPGRVVNIASIAAFKTLSLNGTYCISKAAVAHMTKCFAREWSRHEVNVNAICPGFIETEMNAQFFAEPAGQKFMSKFPRRRVGEETDLNELLLYLLSPASKFVNGSTIVADDAQVLG
ncbi:MAG: SDR family NAD(P)-dependent oxidoreductase [Pseudomonadota bacterium]